MMYDSQRDAHNLSVCEVVPWATSWDGKEEKVGKRGKGKMVHLDNLVVKVSELCHTLDIACFWADAESVTSSRGRI